jgi:ArsR family transcriptional regulator, arsenate/arsenite/antimonite-responsive transcriptional repressor
MENKRVLKIVKALSDSTRLKVLGIIGKKGEISCQELIKYFSLSQPTLSHHFNKLIEAEIITSRKDGTIYLYNMNYELLENYGININKLLTNY